MSKQWKVEIAATGKWNSSTAGWVEITKDHLNGIVKAFNELRGQYKPMLKLGHNEKQPLIKGAKDGQPALGWADALEVVGNKLVATFKDVPDVLYNAIKARRYSRVSVEIQPNVKVSGKTYPQVLTAVGLLGADIPAINVLEDLQTYMSQGDLVSDPIVYTSFKEENDMSDENLKIELAELKVTVEQMKSDHGEVVRKLTEENETLKNQVATFTEEKAAADGEKAKAEFTTSLEQLVKDGKMTPAQRDEQVKLFTPENADLMTKQLAVFSAGASVGPGADEQGRGNNNNSGSGDADPADVRVLKLAQKRASDDKIDLSAAIQLTLQDNQDLAKEYMAMNDGGAS